MNDPISPISHCGAEASGSPQASTALSATGDTLQVFSGIAAFDAAQRMARALCSSTLVPREYQGQQGLANSLIALEIAGRMRLSPLVVMQNMTPIHGRPTWSSKFLIATVNASGRFSPLRFVFDDKEKPSRCHAVATDKATGEVLEGETITLELARREGWWSRKDRQGNETSKWQTMTGQMLRYRAAAWWANVYCPEIALGLITQEEALDIEPVTVREAGGFSAEAAAIPAVPAALQPGAGAAGSDGAAPQQIRLREPSSIDQVDADQADADQGAAAVQSQPGQAREGSAEIIDGQLVAQASQQRRTHGAGAEASAAAATTAPRRSRNQGAQPPAPGPAQASATATAATAPAAAAPIPAQPPPPESDPVALGLRQIPRIATLLELDSAYGRVNRLLSAGEISDEQAEQLWSAIASRRQQLEHSEVAGPQRQGVER